MSKTRVEKLERVLKAAKTHIGEHEKAVEVGCVDEIGILVELKLAVKDCDEAEGGSDASR